MFPLRTTIFLSWLESRPPWRWLALFRPSAAAPDLWFNCLLSSPSVPRGSSGGTLTLVSLCRQIRPTRAAEWLPTRPPGPDSLPCWCCLFLLCINIYACVLCVCFFCAWLIKKTNGATEQLHLDRFEGSGPNVKSRLWPSWIIIKYLIVLTHSNELYPRLMAFSVVAAPC